MELYRILKKKLIATPRRHIAAVLVIFFAGSLFAFALRFVLVDDDKVHYHANFALYVNGTRDTFEGPSFYEEVASCSVAEANPKALVHMHDSVSHVIHAHNDSVTWGLFFENISYSVSREALVTDDGIFVDGVDSKKLTFMLNGKIISSIANRVIGSEDVLLIDYGVSSEGQLKVRYDEIIRDAGEYNKRNDPSACTGSKTETFKHRIYRTLGLKNTH